MAAAVFAAYLTNVLLIADNNVRIGLVAQGLQSFDDFESLTDEDVSDICTNLRKPGGLVTNPNFNPANPAPGIPPVIPNPGVQVSHLTEKRLKMLAYYCFHLTRIQRPFAVANATLPVLTDCYKLQDQHKAEDEKKIDLPGKLTNIDKIRQVLENIDDYLSRARGESNIPLLYIVRDSSALPPVDDGYGNPTFDAEMIERGPHTGTYYQRDNITVWNVIRHVTHEGPGWSWVSEHQRTCNGRAAYQSIKAHYLGDQFTARLRASADSVLETAFFDGKSRSFTFERYCESLQMAFTDIEGTGEPVSESRKLRVFLQGIIDPRLQSAKSQVLATPSLQSYNAAVNFTAQFLEQRQSLQQGSNRNNTRNISAFDRNNRGGRTGRGDHRQGFRGSGRGYQGRGRSGRGQRTGRGWQGRHNGNQSPPLTDAYMPPEEWSKLTSEQQQKVRQLRSDRDARRNVQVITRNVKQRTDDGTVVTAMTNATSIDSVTTGIGATMSQRNTKPNQRDV